MGGHQPWTWVRSHRVKPPRSAGRSLQDRYGIVDYCCHAEKLGLFCLAARARRSVMQSEWRLIPTYSVEQISLNDNDFFCSLNQNIRSWVISCRSIFFLVLFFWPPTH